MFTDIVGYTALMARDEEAARAARSRHEAVVRPLVVRYNGHWIERTGDETLSSFPSALDAVNCALAIQAELDDDPDLRLRVGIHQGDVTFDADGVSGDGVNVAARVRPIASGDVHHSVRGRSGLEFEALGEQKFKNVDHPVPVFSVSGTPAPPRQVSKPGTPRRGAIPLAGWVVAAALVAAVAAVALYLMRSGPELSPTGPALTSIAVLPFDDLSPDGDQKWLANGMAEDLIESLSRIRELRVIARTSSEIAKASGADLGTIGEQLQVGAIVEGSVRRSGDQLHVTAQFIRAADQSHLWSGRYDRKLDDVFAIQRVIARDVAEAIRTELGIRGSPIGPWLERERYEPRDVRAWELVRRGWDLLMKGINTGQREPLVQALELFREAARIDPDYAAAHGGIRRTPYTLWRSWGRLEEHKQLALEAANRVREIDPTRYGIQQFEALLSWHRWDFEAAEEVLAPLVEAYGHQDAGVQAEYANVLFATGRTDEACVHWRKAAEVLREARRVCTERAAALPVEKLIKLSPDDRPLEYCIRSIRHAPPDRRPGIALERCWGSVSPTLD
jgi:TolB-like protein